MEFFEKIYPVLESGKLSLTMVLSKPVHGKIAVSVLPKPTDEKTDELKKIKPLVVSGTPAELDAGFINELTSAGRVTNGLLSSIEEFNELVAKEKQAVVKKAEKKAENVKKKATPIKKADDKQPSLF